VSAAQGGAEADQRREQVGPAQQLHAVPQGGIAGVFSGWGLRIDPNLASAEGRQTYGPVYRRFAPAKRLPKRRACFER
jgi:hypothetical protein